MIWGLPSALTWKIHRCSRLEVVKLAGDTKLFFVTFFKVLLSSAEYEAWMSQVWLIKMKLKNEVASNLVSWCIINAHKNLVWFPHGAPQMKADWIKKTLFCSFFVQLQTFRTYSSSNSYSKSCIVVLVLDGLYHHYLAHLGPLLLREGHSAMDKALTCHTDAA